MPVGAGDRRLGAQRPGPADPGGPRSLLSAVAGSPAAAERCARPCRWRAWTARCSKRMCGTSAAGNARAKTGTLAGRDHPGRVRDHAQRSHGPLRLPAHRGPELRPRRARPWTGRSSCSPTARQPRRSSSTGGVPRTRGRTGRGRRRGGHRLARRLLAARPPGRRGPAVGRRAPMDACSPRSGRAATRRDRPASALRPLPGGAPDDGRADARLVAALAAHDGSAPRRAETSGRARGSTRVQRAARHLHARARGRRDGAAGGVQRRDGDAGPARVLPGGLAVPLFPDGHDVQRWQAGRGRCRCRVRRPARRRWTRARWRSCSTRWAPPWSLDAVELREPGPWLGAGPGQRTGRALHRDRAARPARAGDPALLGRSARRWSRSRWRRPGAGGTRRTGARPRAPGDARRRRAGRPGRTAGGTARGGAAGHRSGRRPWCRPTVPACRCRFRGPLGCGAAGG